MAIRLPPHFLADMMLSGKICVVGRPYTYEPPKVEIEPTAESPPSISSPSQCPKDKAPSSEVLLVFMTAPCALGFTANSQ